MQFTTKYSSMKQKMLAPWCSSILTVPVTNSRALTHLCDWLLVCMCVYVREPGLCVICSHTRGSGLYVFLFFFFYRVLLLGNCLYALEFPLCWWKWLRQCSPHIPHLPFLPEWPPFCFSLLPLSCSLLPAQPLESSSHLLMLYAVDGVLTSVNVN